MDFITEKRCDIEGVVTLLQIETELNDIVEKANKGLPFDESRIDVLVKARDEHPEYIERLAKEREEFLAANYEYMKSCLMKMRSFIPPDIHAVDEDKLKELYSYKSDLTRRLKQKQCLWLTRMKSSDIARMHESDLLSRYAVDGQNLDIVEIAAVYLSLPQDFANDAKNLKKKWSCAIEATLFSLLEQKSSNTLPGGKLRNAAYASFPEKGPVEDLESMRTIRSVASVNYSDPRRKSFNEICGEFSILSKRSSRTTKTPLPNGENGLESIKKNQESVP
jgi:hypothetical protein